MTLTFYPNSDDMQKGSVDERIEMLMEAAERYKAVVLDMPSKDSTGGGEMRFALPRQITAAYNWEEITNVLREIREMPEINKADKLKKSQLLTKLAEVYEVLRGAKMSKLEAVRLALISEATHLRNIASQAL